MNWLILSVRRRLEEEEERGGKKKERLTTDERYEKVTHVLHRIFSVTDEDISVIWFQQNDEFCDWSPLTCCAGDEKLDQRGDVGPWGGFAEVQGFDQAFRKLYRILKTEWT